MEKVESDSDRPPDRSGKPGFSLYKWARKFLSGNKNENLSPEDREKAIEESIEQFATQVSSEDNVLEEDEREMIHGVVELGGTTVKASRLSNRLKRSSTAHRSRHWASALATACARSSAGASCNTPAIR